MRTALPLLLLASGVTALAAQPVDPWSGSRRPMTDADLAFRPTGDEAYTESMSLDAKGDDGSRVGMTFVVTNIGIGDDSAGVRISVTLGGREMKRTEEPDRWRRSRGKLGLKIGGTTLRGKLSKIRVEHGNKDFGFDLEFVPLVPAWRPGSGRTTFGSDGKRFYEFSLPMPLARVQGRVRTGKTWKPFKGIGSVDHSRVNIYPHDQATRWYRFRTRSEKGMLQLTSFETTEEFGQKKVGWVLAARGGRVLHESDTLELVPKDLRPDPRKPAYRVPWGYEFRSGRGLRGTARGLERTSRLDYLSTMGKLKRWVVSRFATPVGYSFRADYDVTVTSGGSEIRLTGTGEMSQTFIK